MEDVVLEDLSNELFIINQITVDRIFSSDNPADNFSLYSFYYKTAKWQKSTLARATDSYVMDCLKWGKERLKKAKDSLKEMGLIQVIQKRDDNRISGWFIKVNYIPNSISVSDRQEVSLSTCRNKETNNIDNKNNKYLNIFNIPKEKEQKEKVKDFSEINNFEDLFAYWEKNKKGGKYKSSFRDRIFAKLKELTKNDFTYAKEVIEYCLANNYQGFYGANGLYYNKSRISKKPNDILSRLNRGEIVMYEDGMEVPPECTVYEGQILKW